MQAINKMTITSSNKEPDAALLNAMSVDVEDYFHAEALASVRGEAGSAALPVRFQSVTHRLLDLFAERQVKGTFFTLGWVAKEAPDLVARIVSEGHELGCHSFSHIRVVEQSRQDFREDLRRAKGALEDASGVALKGYRAPTFSINQETFWAYEILAEEGFSYSSSIYPVAHDLYGMPGASRVPFHPVDGLDLLEIPMSTVRFGSRILQGGGGGYFRLLPYGLSSHFIRKVNRQERQPFIFYFHPWEIDTEQPRVPSLSAKSRLRHYTNLSKMERKIERLLSDFPWGRMDEAYGHLLESSCSPSAASVEDELSGKAESSQG